MPTIEVAMKQGPGRFNRTDNLLLEVIRNRQEEIWSLIPEDLRELQELCFDPPFNPGREKEIRASIHKLYKREFIDRVKIGRWFYGSHEACKLVEEQFRKEHRTQVCEKCGTRYTPNRSDQKYCGEKCRSAISSKAYTARKNDVSVMDELALKSMEASIAAAAVDRNTDT
jgi:hypothetical protein